MSTSDNPKSPIISSEDELRSAAEKRVHRKRGFYSYLGIWAAVSLILTAVWAFSGGGYYWPVWAIFGMGIAAVFQFIDIFVSRPVTQADVDREMKRMRGEP